jgi:SnoaL-like domain
MLGVMLGTSPVRGASACPMIGARNVPGAVPPAARTRRPSRGADLAKMATATREVSSEAVATIRRLLSAFNRGDPAALDELDGEVELQDEPRLPGAGWNHGHRGAIAWSVKLWQSFDRLVVGIGDPVGVDGSVVARWHAVGKGKRSGIEVHMYGYCAFTMRRGRVRRVTFHETQDEAVEAVRRTA